MSPLRKASAPRRRGQSHFKCLGFVARSWAKLTRFFAMFIHLSWCVVVVVQLTGRNDSPDIAWLHCAADDPCTASLPNTRSGLAKAFYCVLLHCFVLLEGQRAISWGLCTPSMSKFVKVHVFPSLGRFPRQDVQVLFHSTTALSIMQSTGCLYPRNCWLPSCDIYSGEPTGITVGDGAFKVRPVFWARRYIVSQESQVLHLYVVSARFTKAFPTEFDSFCSKNARGTSNSCWPVPPKTARASGGTQNHNFYPFQSSLRDC
jgi:hypothetical protein